MTERLYKAKFHVEGSVVKLACRGTELFEHIKERIWRKGGLTVDKSKYVFKLRNHTRVFNDFENFQRLVAVYGDPTEKLEALVVLRTAASLPEAKALTQVRIKDDGSIPIQGDLDLMSGISETATATPRYYVLKNDQKLGPTLFCYASDFAFYQREAAISSVSIGNCQALKVEGMKYCFQLIRMEDGGKTGKIVLRGDGANATKCWLQAMRQLNFNLTKSRGLASSVWVPDASVSSCMRCDQKFTLIRRKHHCRGCGAVVCAECSKYKLTLADSQEQVRVCKHCYKDYKKDLKTAKKLGFMSPTGDEDALSSSGSDISSRSQSRSTFSSPSSKTSGDEAFNALRENVRMSIKNFPSASSIEGYLLKQSASGLKPWQKRYFVLEESQKRIMYYTDKKTRLAGTVGMIELKDVTDCFHIKDDRIRFDIVTGKKSYPIQAPSPAVSSRWVTHINRILREMNTPPPPDPTSNKRQSNREALSPLKQAAPAITLEGLLKKKHPRSTRIFTGWQDRYFILNQTSKTMTYYKKNPHTFPEEKILGTLDLRDIAMCKTDFTDRKLPQFNIWMRTGRQYCLLCSREAEAARWCSSINSCLAVYDPQLKDELTHTRSPHGTTKIVHRSGAPRPLHAAGLEIGWPQLTANLETQELIPIVLRILGFCSQDDLPHCAVLCRFWKVITEEVMAVGEETDEEDDDSEPEVETPQKAGPPRRPPPRVVSDDDEEMGPHIVIDNGTHAIRGGFAGEHAPKALFHHNAGSVIDPRLQAEQKATSIDGFNHFIDTPATWKSMEKMLKMVFAQLKSEPSERNVMITQPIMAAKYIQENMERILFEKYKVLAVHVATAPILTCYSYGKFTGLVIDIGHTSAQVCPIVEGYLKDSAVRRAQHLGGEAMTRRMYEFLKYTTVKKLPLIEALNIAQVIKEKYCFVPLDYKKAVADPKNKISYLLPSGESITIQRALPSIGEMYFDPRKLLADKDESIMGIQELVESSINASEMDTRSELLNNVLLSGGGTMIKGFVERLDLELKRQLPHAADTIKVHADKDRHNAVWRGGAVLANIDVFQKKWHRREEWVADH